VAGGTSKITNSALGHRPLVSRTNDVVPHRKAKRISQSHYLEKALKPHLHVHLLVAMKQNKALLLRDEIHLRCLVRL
jgi:hypothetical protein